MMSVKDKMALANKYKERIDSQKKAGDASDVINELFKNENQEMIALVLKSYVYNK